MSLHLDGERLEAARLAAFRQLASAANARGAWIGELSSSPLATAAAVTALVVAEQHVDDQPHVGAPGHDSWMSGVLIREELTQLLMRSLRWLAGQQNPDGGWGDAERAPSNLAATLLVRAALQMTGVPAKFAGLVERAEEYVDHQGGAAALRQCNDHDPAFGAAVLMTYALADLTSWRQVPAVPIELALLPRRWRERVLGPGPSFAATVHGAVGAARLHHAPPRNPLRRWLRRAAIGPCLKQLDELQPASGGFLASIPATSFIVTSLASADLGDKAVVRRGVEFLLATVRPDGSWSADADRAVWNTAQAVCTLDETVATSAEEAATNFTLADAAVDWLVGRRQNEPAAGVKRACGGWSASGWDGGPVAATATGAVLRALAASQRTRARRMEEGLRLAALAGIEWLLAMEHDEGGWANYQNEKWSGSRAADVTAEVLRGLDACQRELRLAASDPALARRVRAAVSRGVAYLVSLQRPDGSWTAAWCGQPCVAEKTNLTCGTALALAACDDLEMHEEEAALRGARWLVSAQQPTGGWAAAAQPRLPATANSPAADACGACCTVEETAAAVRALLPFRGSDPQIERSVESALAWLCDGANRADEPSVIGLSFDRMWYYDRLQAPLAAAQALSAACRELNAASLTAAAAAAHA
jgi:squalene-hopene/tetraprenyl-beta-curcumene cyclase